MSGTYFPDVEVVDHLPALSRQLQRLHAGEDRRWNQHRMAVAGILESATDIRARRVWGLRAAHPAVLTVLASRSHSGRVLVDVLGTRTRVRFFDRLMTQNDFEWVDLLEWDRDARGQFVVCQPGPDGQVVRVESSNRCPLSARAPSGTGRRRRALTLVSWFGQIHVCNESRLTRLQLLALVSLLSSCTRRQRPVRGTTSVCRCDNLQTGMNWGTCASKSAG
jgi:hypothetical protein